MARTGDWVPCLGYGLPVTALDEANAPPVAVILARPVGGGGIGATVEVTDEIVTERVVGQLSMDAAQETPVVLCMRIRVGLYDEVNNTAAFYAENLFNEDGANEPFLWQRYVQLTQADSFNLDVFAHPWWSNIDVKVARRLQRDQALFLSLQVGGNGGFSARVTPFLRTWARMAK